MKVDQDYENTEAAVGGQYDPPPPGGYIFQVLEVSEKPSTSGKAMVTLSLDVAEGDFAGCFQKFPKKYRQLVNGDNLPYFKAMVQAFEESNDFSSPLVEDGDFDAQRLRGKLVGGCIREAEYKHQESGEIKVGLEINFLCALERVPDIKPPKLKKLAGQAGAPRTMAAAGSSFRGPSAQDDSDLPF